jgi:S-adenosylmethionine decarboxylase proenzyme
MGKHLLLEIYSVDYNLLNELEPLLKTTLDAIKRANMTILNTYSHQFTPQGLTIVVCLAESHVSLHTFPENNCISIDCYTCGESNPKIIAIELLKYFNSDDYQIRELYR